jgi:predicted RNA binding protein YcfA (HicA-like mRNA interferase family)
MAKTIYRELTALLSAAGFALHRKGKGSHEVCRRESDQRQVVVARTIKSHVLGNRILSAAGLPKHFK